MNRREAIHRTTLLIGGTIIGAEYFLSGCARPGETRNLFSTEDIAFLDEVGETILPATSSSPGAKAAHIGEFMKLMVTECYEMKDQEVFITGISNLHALSKSALGKEFLDLSVVEKENLLVVLDKEAKDADQKKKEEASFHYFTMIKQLTVLGYFSSEAGATKALRYVPIPGHFEGCIDYKKGEKAWAI